MSFQTLGFMVCLRSPAAPGKTPKETKLSRVYHSRAAAEDFAALARQTYSGDVFVKSIQKQEGR